MTSRLASLLVQERAVSAERMAEAFRRQVIYGGTLDTNLLEVGLVEEGALRAAIGRAADTPREDPPLLEPSTPAEELAKLLDRALAERFQVAPLGRRDDRVVLLVTYPPDPMKLAELATILHSPVDPRAGLEFELHLALERVYGVGVPPRFAALAARSWRRGERSGRLARQATERPAVTEEAVPEPVQDSDTVRIFKPSGATAGPHLPSSVAVSHSYGVQALGEANDRDEVFRILCKMARARFSFAALFAVQSDSAVAKVALGESWIERSQLAQAVVPFSGPSAFRTASSTRAPYLGWIDEDDVTARAMAELGRPRALWAALLPIVISDRTVAILEVDDDGRVRDARELGDLISATADASRAFQRLILRAKGERPAAPTPVAGGADFVKRYEQVRGEAPAPSAPEEETLPGLAPEILVVAPPAVEPTEPPAVEAEPELELVEDDGEPPTDAVAEPAVAPADAAVVVTPESPSIFDLAPPGEPAGSPPVVDEEVASAFAELERPAASGTSDAAPRSESPLVIEQIASALDEVEHGSPGGPSAAEALLQMGDEAARMLAFRLPGRLHREVGRDGAHGTLAEHGPLLALAPRFGHGIVKHLTPLLESLSLEVRLYVTLVFAELRLPDAVPPLGRRLCDPAAAVRRLAARVLARFEPGRAMNDLLDLLRSDLFEPDPTRQRDAADALGELRDARAVIRLVELIKHQDANVGDAALRALVQITKQDFRTSRWRWRSWWEKNQGRSRLEWLLDGLKHEDAVVRRSASDELESLALGPFFYHADLPTERREEARKKWASWHAQRGAQ